MISPGVFDRVLIQAQSSARHSWEYGIVFEALLEYYNPSISVFNDPFPGNKLPDVDEETVPALKYVKPFILTDGHQLCEGNGEYFQFFDGISKIVVMLAIKDCSTLCPYCSHNLITSEDHSFDLYILPQLDNLHHFTTSRSSNANFRVL